MDFGINLATSADSWKVVKRAEILGPWSKLLGELESLVPGEGPFEVCFEASCGYGHLYERLSANGIPYFVPA